MARIDRSPQNRDKKKGRHKKQQAETLVLQATSQSTCTGPFQHTKKTCFPSSTCFVSVPIYRLSELSLTRATRILQEIGCAFLGNNSALREKYYASTELRSVCFLKKVALMTSQPVPIERQGSFGKEVLQIRSANIRNLSIDAVKF